MSKAVRSCGVDDSLQQAAQIMWEGDCGIVPVIGHDGRVAGVITDRDICMAAYTHGQALWQLQVSSAMAKQVHGMRENDSLDAAEGLMRRARVRRVPVLDADGRLRGILSMSDLACHNHNSKRHGVNGLSGDSIAQTLAAICEPRIVARAQVHGQA
jgi:CBS domain-containing protein